MSTGEFQLIERHFTALGAARPDVLLGVGDDAALLAAPSGCRLAVASYSAGAGAAPDTLARECFDRAALVLRANGATPAWLTMALSLQRVHEPWIERFCATLHECCAAAGVCVVGGDTTAGADAVTVFLTGIVPA